MNKKQLISSIASTGHFKTKKAAGEFLNELIDIIEAEVITGNDVSITGFGKFEKYEKLNGVKVPKFRPFQSFKRKVA